MIWWQTEKQIVPEWIYIIQHWTMSDLMKSEILDSSVWSWWLEPALINTKGTRVVCDGLRHCCSTPNPLHQSWAHPATHRNMVNRQHCNSLPPILTTVKNNSEYQHGKCFSPVLHCINYGQPRHQMKGVSIFPSRKSHSFASLYTFRIYLVGYMT